MEEVSFVSGLEGQQHIGIDIENRVDKGPEVGKVTVY